jgi:hypothetical protein
MNRSAAARTLLVTTATLLLSTAALADEPEATGRYVREVTGRPVESGEEPMSLQAEISEWVAQQLRQAPVSGQRRATIALGQNRSGAISAGDYTGQAEVELNWKLERL